MVERTQLEEADPSFYLERIALRQSVAGVKLGLHAEVPGKQEWRVADVNESRAWSLEPLPKGTLDHPARPEPDTGSEALLARLIGGVEQAFADLYDGTNRIVYRLELRILAEPSAAEDVTMDVYIHAGMAHGWEL